MQENETPLEAAADSDPELILDAEGLARTRKPVTVFSASTHSEGEIIRGLLESEGIPAVYDAVGGGISDSNLVIMGDSMLGVVVVAQEDEARAKELIAAYSTPVSDQEIDSASDGA